MIDCSHGGAVIVFSVAVQLGALPLFARHSIRAKTADYADANPPYPPPYFGT